MKSTILPVAALVYASGFASSAYAQAVQAPLSIERPIEQLMADPNARAVLQKELPDLDKHPMYETFKSMNLVQLEPLSSGQITKEKLEAIKAALANVDPAK